MLVQTFPSGITVSQAKKDAKRLAAKKRVDLSQAQDEIAFLHGRSTWPALMKQTAQQSEIKFSFDREFQIAAEPIKSLTMILGEPGSGKTMLLLEMVTQLISSGRNVVALTNNNVKSQDHALFVKLGASCPERFTVYAHHEANLSTLQLNGAVLVVDDLSLVSESYQPSEVQSLFRCAQHVIATVHDPMHLSLVRKLVPRVMLDLLFLKCGKLEEMGFGEFNRLLDDPEDEKIIGLFAAIKRLKANDDVREFVHVNNDGFTLLRFESANAATLKKAVDSRFFSEVLETFEHAKGDDEFPSALLGK